MADDVPGVLLNANQRRHFEVLFARLEDTVRRVERWLADLDDGAVLSVFDHDVTERQRREALGVLLALRQRIAELASELELSPRRQSRRRAIAAALTSEAIRMEDSLSSQLRGYGAVHESVSQRLDPILLELAGTLAALAAAFRPERRSERE